MALGMVAFWAFVIGAVWYLLTSARRDSPGASSNADAKQILDQRLARGDIDAEEYGRLRDLMWRDEARADKEQSPVGAGDRR